MQGQSCPGFTAVFAAQLRELCLRRVRESRDALLNKHRGTSDHVALQVSRMRPTVCTALVAMPCFALSSTILWAGEPP